MMMTINLGKTLIAKDSEEKSYENSLSEAKLKTLSAAGMTIQRAQAGPGKFQFEKFTGIFYLEATSHATDKRPSPSASPSAVAAAAPGRSAAPHPSAAPGGAP